MEMYLSLSYSARFGYTDCVTLDILYIALTISVLVLTSFLATLLWQAQKTLKGVNDILLDVQDITHDIRALKQQTKTGALGIFRTILSFITDNYPFKPGRKD